MGRRLLISAAVVVALIVAAVVAAAAYTALKSPLTASNNSNLSPENCSPGPCANLSGDQLWVSNVSVTNDLVHMTVKFQNSSSSTHTSPEDLQLIDAARRSSIPVTDVSGCNTWTRHEYKNKGDTFGPIDICFRVTNTAPPFLLRWSPDIGAFCCETSLRIDLS